MWSARPPHGLPIYRLLSGTDDEDFCRKVSAVLELGFRLHGSPAVTVLDGKALVVQAVTWPVTEQ